MIIFGREIGFSFNVRKQKPIVINQNDPTAYFQGKYSNLRSFDGEKNPYELGNPQSFVLDYYTLRLRSWEAFIKTDFVQNAIRKYCLWIAGPGLKLQSEPSKQVLNNNGINITDSNIKSFTEIVESKFRLYAESNFSSYTGNQGESVHSLAAEALKNAILAGDCLIIQRLENNNVTTEIIDGHLVRTPIGGNHISDAETRNNKIINGVEIDKKGTHIAYYVAVENFEYQRIPTRTDKTRRIQAWLMYGMKGKINDVRGMSLLTAVLESATKLDRYKEATIGSAEENAKIPFTIEHGSDSDGEDILKNQIVQAYGTNTGKAPETQDEICENKATNIAKTTNKQVYNMPIGAKLVSHTDGTDINFPAFFQPNIEIIYATLGIPPEVAADKFGGAYSGSRAALKSWEYKMIVDRIVVLKRHYYQPVFNYWFDVQVLNDKITAPGYITAVVKSDVEVIEAYRKTRFIGAGVPHIDPLKEVKAERSKLGTEFDNVPLSTAEQSMETLNSGDYNEVIKKSSNEKEIFDESFPISDSSIVAKQQ